MIIGISGKIGSGKDTIGEIINFLLYQKYFEKDKYVSNLKYIPKVAIPNTPNKFVIKKFADKLKDTVCLWTNCTREQLEDQEFKDTEIGPEWVRYAKAIGFGDRDGQRVMWTNTCTKEEYEEELRVNWQTAYKKNLTYRDLLQLLGTECGRNTIHNNMWVNTLMSDYICNRCKEYPHNYHNKKHIKEDTYPNWIITDVRFPNELNAIKDKGGISIRVNRPWVDKKKEHQLIKEHESETALDNAEFDYVINNAGTIEDLIETIRILLIRENII